MTLPIFSWADTPGDFPEAVQHALPVLGITVSPGATFACVLPGHEGYHHARVSPRDLRYTCEVREGSLRVVDVFAARRFAAASVNEPAHRLSAPSAAAWWGRLWIEARLLTLDLPDVEPDANWPNRDVTERVFRGIVLLQAVHAAGALRQAAPVDLSREFAAAWCDVHPMQAYRALKTLAERGYVARQKVKPKRGYPGWRYELTGKGLSAPRPEQAAILAAITPTTTTNEEAA
jgi:hypothetical protein